MLCSNQGAHLLRSSHRHGPKIHATLECPQFLFSSPQNVWTESFGDHESEKCRLFSPSVQNVYRRSFDGLPLYHFPILVHS